MSRSYDVIVIGGGHNGLVCAAYLARAGQSVMVLEARDQLGGAACTTALGRWFKAPALAHTVGRLAPEVAADLELYDRGLRLIQPEVRVFAPGEHPLTLWGDPARTARELRSAGHADAQRWVEFDSLVRRLSAPIALLAHTLPPDLSGPGSADVLSALKLFRSARGLGASGMRTLTRTLPMSIGDFVREHLTSDHLCGVNAARGIMFTSAGVHSAGTALNLLADSAGSEGGAAGSAVFAQGGPGALADALAAAVRAHGGTIRTGAAVARIATREGRVSGIVLESGEEVESAAVVSSADPRSTLLDLVDPVDLGPTLGWRASNIRARGSTAKVNLALDRLPQFLGAEDVKQLQGRIVVTGGIDDMEQAFDASKYGEIPERPVLEATIPTLCDPSLAPSGRHVMSVIVQYAPYELSGATWAGRAGELGDRVMSILEEHAPGLSALVRDRRVITPADLESDWRLSGGHPMHAEQSLDQFFAWRPLFGLARYRLDPEGLYLCGAGAHPGGGVTGLPGAAAARAVIADRPRS